MGITPALLKRLRLASGLTQREAAAAASLNYTTVARIETSDTATVATLEKLLPVYGYKLTAVPDTEWTPEGVEGLVLLASAGRDLHDAVESLLHDENAGSLMERMNVLERIARRFEVIDRAVSIKEQGHE